MEKNILFIIDSLGGGGAERIVLTLADTLLGMGHNIVLISIRNERELDINRKIKLLTLGFSKKRLIPYYYWYAHKLRKMIQKLEEHGKFDIIFSHLIVSNRLCALARINNIHYCIHSPLSASNLAHRRGLSRSIKRWKLKRIFDNKHLIAISNGMADDIIDRAGIKPHSIDVIYNPVDRNQIDTLADEVNLYAGISYIVCPARFVKLKRHDLLLEAYAKSGLEEKLVLLGDGTERGNIEQRANELGLSGKVIFSGFHTNPYPIIKGAMLSVLSSDYEGLPTVIIESMILNVPVISTDCLSGPSEILTGNLSRFLVPVGDAVSLAAAMKKTIAEIKATGINLDEVELEKFDPTHIAMRYLALGDATSAR